MSNVSEEREERIASDARTFQVLAEQGADFAKEHSIDFFFVGEERLLQGVEAALALQGYVKNPEHEVANELMVQRNLTLEAMQSQNITEMLYALAIEHGVDFDGWGTVARK
ncbi:ribonuclease E inhibitor RraB [Patescibacteria group bacterium]|nr:ribonuclease E inhibitor RraB [Patescibacteria group bacterium]MBP9710115.1 ribonuclease E inhibitor RraB [Patescibacteria group bacterium]